MKKMGYEEFRLFSLIFAYFRLFSLIFKIGLSSKKDQPISCIDCPFAFLERFFLGNHLFSDFIILFVNFGFYANLSYSMGFCLSKIFNLFYERHRIEPWTSRLKSRNMLEPGKRKTNLGLHN